MDFLKLLCQLFIESKRTWQTYKQTMSISLRWTVLAISGLFGTCRKFGWLRQVLKVSLEQIEKFVSKTFSPSSFQKKEQTVREQFDNYFNNVNSHKELMKE